MQTSAESWACISTTGASHACQETCSGTCSAGPAPENQSCCLLVRQDQDVCHCHTVLFPKFEPVCRLHCIVHCTVQFSRKKAWLSYSYCDCDSTKKTTLTACTIAFTRFHFQSFMTLIVSIYVSPGCSLVHRTFQKLRWCMGSVVVSI